MIGAFVYVKFAGYKTNEITPRMSAKTTNNISTVLSVASEIRFPIFLYSDKTKEQRKDEKRAQHSEYRMNPPKHCIDHEQDKKENDPNVINSGRNSVPDRS